MSRDRVLLVDDEVEFVETLAERMRTRGLEVATAGSGLEALERFSSQDFDAVVLDLAMPDLDGIETLKRLRARDPNIQIVLLSGQATIRLATEAMKQGAVDVLEKPADIDVLIDMIRQARATRLRLSEQKTQENVDELLKRRGW
jgi:DNA-binding NtrC family response regulator